MRESESLHTYIHTTVHTERQERWLLVFFKVNIFFLSGYFAVNTLTPASFHHLIFLLSLPLLHREGQWINLCRYYTAQRVRNWPYSGSGKPLSSHRSRVRPYTNLSLWFGLDYITWRNQGAGITLTTTHNCPFPLMLPNNSLALILHSTLLLQRACLEERQRS